MMRVGISHDFFAKGLNDYADWRWAFCRELSQNAVDAGADNVHFTINTDGNTEVVCWNDGPPMDRETLLDKFLCLGGTTKTDGDTVGGFGIAKTVIALAHRSYKIETGEYCVKGSGGDFELTECEYYSGVRTSVVIDGDHTDRLRSYIRRWVRFAQCKATFHIDGVVTHADMRKGSPRRDLGFGRVYTNKSSEYEMVVRINGMPMFIQSTDFNRLVIVELDGNSSDFLTSNRDGLVYPYGGQLSSFVTELAVDKRSALKNNRGPKYTEYRGVKLCHSSALNVAAVVEAESDPAELVAVGVIDETPKDGPIDGISVLDEEHLFGQVEIGGFNAVSTVPVRATTNIVQSKPRLQVATLGTNFLLKNETDLKIPAYYDPGSGGFSIYSFKLVRIWGRIMLEMHRLFDHEGEFSVGFVFDDGDVCSTEAQCEQGDYGLVYYLNPCRIVEQSNSYSKSFKKRFKLTERDRLIMIGLHEFCHLGCSWHDEVYANKLTDMSAFVLKHRKKFNWCFK